MPGRWSWRATAQFWLIRRWFWRPGKNFEWPRWPYCACDAAPTGAHMSLLQGAAVGTGVGLHSLGRTSHMPWSCGSLPGDIMSVLTLGCGVQWPPPSVGTLSTHGQQEQRARSGAAQGLWVPPTPTLFLCWAVTNPPLPPQPCQQLPHQDEGDSQCQLRWPQPLPICHPGALCHGPWQTAHPSPPEHPGVPCPPQGSVPSARESASPRSQNPQAQRHWQSCWP